LRQRFETLDSHKLHAYAAQADVPKQQNKVNAVTQDPQPYKWRKTTQHLLHDYTPERSQNHYNIFPTHTVTHGAIEVGFMALAKCLIQHKIVLIDGYIGVFWDDFRQRLAVELDKDRVHVTWLNMANAMQPEQMIGEIAAPFLGGDDPIFGKRAALSLLDLFDEEKLNALEPDAEADLTIAYGCGASLLNWRDVYLVYLDLPKNEIQYRSRAQTAWNLGQQQAYAPKPTYKRYYFFDWTLLNKHKAKITSSIDLIVDVQKPDEPMFMSGDAFRAELTHLTETVFRVRPWFEPGAWGGQWMKTNIPDLPQNVPNYAWSFEMIAPEQGVIFEQEGNLLEVSFDFLMYHDSIAVMGKYARYFGCEFPIRFDFLDTIQGSNLSIQCHPRPDYIRTHFGEHFTQDETYYIFDCEPDALVYLGFQDDIEPQAFRQALEKSNADGLKVNITDYVQAHPAKKHDLFLIPNGTIHASGAGSLVLEISATPYIFTFKMYDWLRLDLDGKPRPINIERAFDNLDFERRGQAVIDDLIPKPCIVDEGEHYRHIDLPTHDAHFYEIQRLEFVNELTLTTDDSVQVLMVVEGQSVIVEVGETKQVYNYAETFIIPAKARTFRLVNNGDGEVKVIRAFMKAAWFEKAENQWLSLP